MASASAPTQASDNQVHRDEEAHYAELIPNLDRIAPPTAAAFGTMMLGTIPKYLPRAQAAFQKDAGFTRVELATSEIALDRLVRRV